jgi:hypothetical protein
MSFLSKAAIKGVFPSYDVTLTSPPFSKITCMVVMSPSSINLTNFGFLILEDVVAQLHRKIINPAMIKKLEILLILDPFLTAEHSPSPYSKIDHRQREEAQATPF